MQDSMRPQTTVGVFGSLISNWFDDRWPNGLATEFGLCVPKYEHPTLAVEINRMF